MFIECVVRNQSRAPLGAKCLVLVIHILLLKELMEFRTTQGYKHSGPTGLKKKPFRTSDGKAAAKLTVRART